jgi:hypothetical protein
MVTGLSASVYKDAPKLKLGQLSHSHTSSSSKQKNEAKKLLLNNIDPQEHRDDAIRTNECANTNTLENISAQWLTIKKAQYQKVIHKRHGAHLKNIFSRP